MKYLKGTFLYLIVALLNLCVIDFAICQDWQLINPERKYNYQSSNSPFIDQTIWVDSLNEDMANRTYYLNRIVRRCIECSEEYLYIKNEPQFLQRQIRDIGNGHYVFSGPRSFTMISQASLSETWLFSEENNITAEVIEMKSSITFGLMDSLKFITLNEIDTLILSKEFGILSFQNPFSDIDIRLVGIDNTEYGEQVPKFREFFNFRVGDELHFISSASAWSSHPWRTNGISRYTVSDVQQFDDSVVIDYQFVKRTWYWSDSRGTSTSSSSGPVQITYIDSMSHFSNLYNHQFFKDDDNFSLDGFVDFYIDSRGLMAKRYLEPIEVNGEIIVPTYLQEEYPIARPDTLAAVQCGYRRYGFEQFRGQIADSFFCFEAEDGYDQVGFVRGTDTTGTIHSEYILTNNSPELVSNLEVKVFPNPCSEFININISNESTITYRAELIDIKGQKIIQIDLHNKANVLDLSQIPAGLYILKLATKNKFANIKIVKQE